MSDIYVFLLALVVKIFSCLATIFTLMSWCSMVYDNKLKIGTTIA